MSNREWVLVLARFCLGITVLFEFSAQGAPGFNRIQDPAIPEAVAKASRSVFRGVIFSGEPLLKLKPSEYDDAIKRLEAGKVDSTEPFALKLGKLQADLVRRCKALKFKSCESGFPHQDSGTFFLAGDKKTLVGVRHVVEEAIGGVGQENLCKVKKKGLRIRLLLLDANEKVVLDSVNGPSKALIRAIGNPELVSSSSGLPPLQALGERYAYLADDLANEFVVIESSSELAAEPLQWAPETIEVPGALYALGFPALTTGRATLGAMDADGLSLYATIGKQVAKLSWLGEVEKPEEKAIDAYLRAHSENAALILDADMNEGLSGGPVVDSEGQVRGVAAIGFVDADAELANAVPDTVWAVRKSAIDGVDSLIAGFAAEACE